MLLSHLNRLLIKEKVDFKKFTKFLMGQDIAMQSTVLQKTFKLLKELDVEGEE